MFLFNMVIRKAVSCKMLRPLEFRICLCAMLLLHTVELFVRYMLLLHTVELFVRYVVIAYCGTVCALCCYCILWNSLCVMLLLHTVELFVRYVVIAYCATVVVELAEIFQTNNFTDLKTAI